MSYIIGILLKILHDERLLLIYFPYRYKKQSNLSKHKMPIQLRTEHEQNLHLKRQNYTLNLKTLRIKYDDMKQDIQNSFKVDNNACLRKNLKTTWCLLPLTLVNTTSCTCCNYNKILIIIHPDNVN